MLVLLLGLQSLEFPVMILCGFLAAMSAVYSAFLFKQARGRVFWHSPLTPLHLVVQAMVAGSAALMLASAIDTAMNGRAESLGWSFLSYELAGALIANGVLIGGELFLPEENIEKMRAARLIIRGLFRRLFWVGAIVLGTVVPLLLILSGAATWWPIAAIVSLCALAGVFIWEHIWVQAGQAVPLS
jgi:formate-dependent nitrite reductase membrane component NrfD